MNAASKTTFTIVISLATALATTLAGAADWPSAGRDLLNSRHQSAETQITVRNAHALRLHWAVSTEGDVTASPALDATHLYFPDSAGYLYKLERATGVQVWKRRLADITGIAGDFARATPALSGNALILGNMSGRLAADARQGARVVAIDKTSGNLLWATQVDATPRSVITQSAVVAKGLVLVGVASAEETAAGFTSAAAGWQFQFRGSVVALDVASGAIKWQTFMVPPGYFGGAVWGSTVAVDAQRDTAYVATGNNYAVPQTVLDCLNNNGAPATCMSPANHVDAIVALGLANGAVKWAARGLPHDTWNMGCGLSLPGFVLPPNDNCPHPVGPDWDFAQGPMLLPGAGPKGSSLVGAGQKSGVFWAFRADTGALAWATQAGPPGTTGGMQWGSASDAQRVYVALANSGPTGAGQAPLPWKLKNGSSTTAGGWAALDRKTGAVLWTTPDPLGSRAEAAVAVANGVVFGCNLDATRGSFYALDAKTGKPLWTHASGGACNAAPSIADGMVFWGSGTFNGYGPKKVFAFGL